MTDTNPQGSVDGSLEAAADQIASLLDSPPAAPDASEDRREEEALEAEPEAPAEPEELPEGEATDEAEEIEASDDVGQDEEVQEPARTFKVGDAEVTEDELVKGYMRQSDYTRKTQEAAALRKESEAVKDAVAQERQRYAEALQFFESQIPRPEPPAPELLDEDPVEYIRQKDAHDRANAQRQAAAVERQRVEQQTAAEREQAAQALIRQESEKLAERIPEWSDPNQRESLVRDIQQEMRDRGFSDAEIGQLAYAHHFEVVKDAMAYRRMMAKKPAVEKKVRDAPKVVKPGTATNRNSKEDELAKARQRLRKSGRVEDAAAAILAMS